MVKTKALALSIGAALMMSIGAMEERDKGKENSNLMLQTFKKSGKRIVNALIEGGKNNTTLNNQDEFLRSFYQKLSDSDTHNPIVEVDDNIDQTYQNICEKFSNGSYDASLVSQKLREHKKSLRKVVVIYLLSNYKGLLDTLAKNAEQIFEKPAFEDEVVAALDLLKASPEHTPRGSLVDSSSDYEVLLDREESPQETGKKRSYSQKKQKKDEFINKVLETYRINREDCQNILRCPYGCMIANDMRGLRTHISKKHADFIKSVKEHSAFNKDGGLTKFLEIINEERPLKKRKTD